MLKKTLIAATLIIVILYLIVLLAYDTNGILYRNLPWLIGVAPFPGIILGFFRGISHNTSNHRSKARIKRHDFDSFLEHWGTASGVFILTVSGFFTRYDFKRGFSANLHFLGLVFSLFFGTYFLVHFFVSKKHKNLLPNTINKYLLGTGWVNNGKYLSSQKAEFLAFSVLGVGILFTGGAKLAAFYLSIPGRLNYVATQAHDCIAYLLASMMLIHISLAFVTRSYRRKLASFFTGNLK